jgi:hypothetical protein
MDLGNKYKYVKTFINGPIQHYLRLKASCQMQVQFRSLAQVSIRALSAASAAKFNIAPVRWQHLSHVAIVPPESKEKREENDWDTACRNFKT